LSDALVCPSCAAAHESHERFCLDCGLPLVREGATEEPPRSALAERARKVHKTYAEGPLVRAAWARNQAEAESTSLVALYDALGVYPPETRQTVRHNIVCYMRSIVSDDWPSMEDGNSTGDHPPVGGHQPLDPATVPRHTPEVARLG